MALVSQKPVPAPDSLHDEKSDISGDLQIEPRDVTFATQDPDERIFILTRKDVITNFYWALQVGILTVAPIIFYLVGLNFDLAITEFLALEYQALLLFLYYSMIFTYALFKFNEWYFNVFLVTNKRIMVYKFSSLNRYKVAEAELKNIQDVSQSVVGLLPSVFNYGNIVIQTAAQKGKFQVRNVPKVTWLRDVLVDLSRLSHGDDFSELYD